MKKITLAASIAAALVLPSAARAGACRDPWINNAYRDLNQGQPNGNDNRGECNIKLYGNGSWSGYDDLKRKVQTYRNSLAVIANGQCRDPFIAQAYQKALGRLPNGFAENGECDMYNYGGGSWSGLDDLVAKVKAYKGISSAPPAVSLAGLRLAPSGDLLNAQGALVARSSEIAGIVAAGGGNIVAAGGGNIINSDGASIVAAGGGNLAPSYGLQSTNDGKKVYGSVTLRDGRRIYVVRK